MSITKEGIDTSTLWARKQKAIEQTAGLSVWKGGEKFADIGGCENAKEFFGSLIKGKRAPRCIVFVDEIEKAVGSQQDTSGTSQAMLGTMLRWMQDKAVTGCILIGPAGCAKSAISKAVGNEANIPTIEFDLSAMKGSLVGESEGKLRGAIATVDAIGQGRVMVLATCNSIGNLPPELRRRFNLGTFFFDLPTVVERQAIWKIYRQKYSLKDALPEDSNWTGAEIRQCCDVADRLGISLKDAANYVVPVARSAAEVIENLRKQASGRFLSASYKGVYQFDQKTIAAPVGRKINME
jgi:SpoVK/Ycf46/Vps4 family AAA+-type ATPase